jgi:hypothetical protein
MRPSRLSPRPARQRDRRPRMVAGRIRPRRDAARPPRQNGKPSAHPLRGDEVRALRELRRQLPDSAFVFATERGGPFARTPSTGSSSASVPAPASPLRSMLTCCVMPAATRSPMPATTRGGSKIGSAIGRSSTRCATPNYRRHDFGTSGAGLSAIDRGAKSRRGGVFALVC